MELILDLHYIDFIDFEALRTGAIAREA